MSKYTKAYLSKTADDLGEVRNQLAELKQAEKKLSQVLQDSGIDAAEGETFRVTVSRSLRTSTNWQAIARRVGFSTQLFNGNTKRTTVIRVNTNAKLGDQEAA